MSQTDYELLRAYADGSQAAFSEVVRRHLDLVYSAARRQTPSSQMAEEVAQSVFISLARSARNVSPATPLAAWLHLATRHAAINTARGEARRRVREQTAFELSAMNATPPAWSHLEPLLDEAVAALPKPDQVAILLRFFENKSLREIGAVLGASENGAQKRVSRALNQLRHILAKRGVVMTAAGLSSHLSVHAIEAAPGTLAATISARAITLTSTGLGTAALATTKSVAMTTFQKSAIAAAVLLLAGAGIYESHSLSDQREALGAARAQRSTVFGAWQNAQQQRAGDARRLTSTREQITGLQAVAAASKGGADDALETEMRAWYAREEALRKVVADNPGLAIPELQLLTDQDWFNAAQETKLSTSDEIRRALGNLRSTAKGNLAQRLRIALQRYAAAHGDMLPANSTDLVPFFDPPIDAAVLARYGMIRTGRVSDLPQESGPRVVMIERDSVDPEFDSQYQLGLNGVGANDWVAVYVHQAQQDFAQANGGVKATTADQLGPYLKASLSPAKLIPFLTVGDE